MKRKDKRISKERKWILIFSINDSKQGFNVEDGNILVTEDLKPGKRRIKRRGVKCSVS